MTPVAIVTGSDSGIGASTAAALAVAGFDVGITYRSDEDGARETARAVEAAGRRAAVRRLELTDAAGAVAAVEGLADDLGGLDAFVQNAGAQLEQPFLQTSLDDWNDLLAVDLTGAFVVAQAAARRLVGAGRGGAIVFVTSIHELHPKTGFAAYCAAKSGLGGLARVMALELGRHGIRVNTVAPGQIATPMTGMEDVDPRTERRPNLPLGRPGDPSEIGAVIAMLCGPGGAYATGGTFLVDGGMALIGPDFGNLEG